MFLKPFDEGWGHIDANFFDVFGVSAVSFQMFFANTDRFSIFFFCSTNDYFLVSVHKDGDIMVSSFRRSFIGPIFVT